MDRSLLDISVDGTGPLTRSIDGASTSGFIREDPAHWSIESFVPIRVPALLEYLVSRSELNDGEVTMLRAAADQAVTIMDQRTIAYHQRFSEAYSTMDPDSDCFDPAEIRLKEVAGKLAEAENTTESQVAIDASEVIAVCEEILQQSCYRRLKQEDIEACVGVASQWGVPLDVDFELFERLLVFARGDVIGHRYRRRWRKLYRREEVAVPLHQRMVVIFQLREDDATHETLESSKLHLRMFRNIPKQDIDMLLPGTRVKISGVDRVKIIVPSLGGLLMSLRKIKLILQYVLLFAAIALHWTAILLGLVIGYIIKSVLSYSKTKNKYHLNLTRNLYFQKLDTNAGVAYRMIQQAHRQSGAEVLLAYFGILSHAEPISARKLRRKCERIVREAIDVEVDFQVDRALESLAEMALIERAADDCWRVVREPVS